ncbi:hypothetical protein C8J57DRAFT_1626523 [Mycena rebaudengoi]|nr:hypothetical protein C8J57DRAFT_1626523 [Mycena rebaudengoi]
MQLPADNPVQFINQDRRQVGSYFAAISFRAAVPGKTIWLITTQTAPDISHIRSDCGEILGPTSLSILNATKADITQMTETAAFSPGGAITFSVDASNHIVSLGGENSTEASDGALISCLNATVGRFGIARPREASYTSREGKREGAIALLASVSIARTATVNQISVEPYGFQNRALT